MVRLSVVGDRTGKLNAEHCEMEKVKIGSKGRAGAVELFSACKR